MFYAFWSLCVEHLNHLLQHLRMFSINDKSEIMTILRQTWTRRYDYLIFKAKKSNLFQISESDENDDDDDDDDDDKK
jgi:sensor histidine kinase YesM